MNYQALKQYCLRKPATTLDFPFGADVSVLRVKKKMFALIGEREWQQKRTLMINLKIDPEHSFALQDLFSAITPGYHMDKKHWISVYQDGTVPDGEVERLIDDSYNLVVATLPKKLRADLNLTYVQTVSQSLKR